MLTFRVFRFNPKKDKKPYFKDYEVPVDRYTRVLEGLIWIKENLDSTLNFRYSCRMAMCGSCGMVVNGRPRLACKTLVRDLKGEVIRIEPIPKFRILRDLVVEMESLFAKHRYVKPYLIRENLEEQESPTLPYKQTPKELEKYIRYYYCVMCGLCSSSCPNFDSGWEYLGPQALAQAYRYLADSRDQGFKERVRILDSDIGVWRCHFAAECSEACPKDVDPAAAIQLLRRKIIFR
jgi:succinate dehydrogenase / fumarate reductase iron-sulfur subunit